jgi:voltage-gated potassium channel
MRDFDAFVRPLVLLLLLTVSGTVGYVLVEGFSPLAALYLTVSTIATVGYGDLHPVSPAGQIFTIGLIVLGVGVALFTLTELVRVIYDGQLGHTLWRKRMDRRVKQLRDHFILCGYGRVGRQIAAELAQTETPLVVVDTNPEELAHAAAQRLATIEGDAGSDHVLRAAGIERARALITAVATDADNMYVTLSARALNPGLRIVARANADEAIPKLKRAGANQIVSPYTIGGHRMAMLALRPLAVEFVDSIFHRDGTDLLLEDVAVSPTSRLVRCTVDQLQTELARGVSILAIKRDAMLLPRPAPATALQSGDELVAIGTLEQLRLLEGLA